MELMTVFIRRILIVVLAAGCVAAALAIGATPGRPAGATTADDLDAARQKLSDARDAANETAAAFSTADHKLEETEANIAKLQASIAAAKARAEELRGIARERARFAYTHPTNSLEEIIGANGAVDAIRRSQLLDQANQTDSNVVKKLAAVDAQLKIQQGDLERQQAAEQAVSDQLDARLASLQAKQSEVAQAVAGLQAKLDAEIAAAAAADAARTAALEAERAVLDAQQNVSRSGAGQILPGPAAGAFQCPVQGAAYSDDYGGPSGHPGIDMFEPTGTPAVAVESGTVTYVANEGAGGNTAYLAAADGNTYFYAHFSQFVGEARAVAQGEIIGLTGMTGNASAPHLHFEIRLGGPNGNRTDPYPTLNAAGC
jgi:murein DD-endopeptidase MepM/ murein hydrolase activator NlpD